MIPGVELLQQTMDDLDKEIACLLQQPSVVVFQHDFCSFVQLVPETINEALSEFKVR